VKKVAIHDLAPGIHSNLRGPLFTLIRDVIVRPMGLAPAQPLAGNRGTFYVPRAEPDASAPGRLSS
jgi:hypothetical protein